MMPFIRNSIGFITLLLLVVLPVGIFTSRTRIKINVGIYWIVLYPIWYLTNSLFHEGSHYLVNVLSGVQIKEVRLIPHFWNGDFSNAFVNTGPESPFQAALGAAAPYWSGVIWVAVGLLLLKRIKKMPLLLASMVLTVCCLRPLADLANNYLAFVAFRFGDFYTVALATGYPVMHFLVLCMLALTLSGCIYGVYGIFQPSKTTEI